MAQTFPIFIKTPNGQKVKVEISENETVDNLKQKVSSKTMFPVHAQVLSYAGRKFETGKSVGEYYIEEECVVKCTLEATS